MLYKFREPKSYSRVNERPQLRTKLIRVGGKTVKTWAVNGASSAFTGCRVPKRKMTVDPSL